MTNMKPQPVPRRNQKTPGLYMAPSLLSADLANLQADVRSVTGDSNPLRQADLLHFDVMDGHFVPNISFGVPVLQCLRKITAEYLDVHLMITDPIRYAEPFIKAGADRLIFHAELIDKPAEVIQAIQAAAEKCGRPCDVGLAVNPHTTLHHVWPVLDKLDLVLIMSVFPGFGGQNFIPEVLDKVRELRPRLRPDQRLEIDGGIHAGTIALAAEAGVDTFVAGTAIFAENDRPAMIAELRRLAQSAGKCCGG